MLYKTLFYYHFIYRTIYPHLFSGLLTWINTTLQLLKHPKTLNCPFLNQESPYLSYKYHIWFVN